MQIHRLGAVSWLVAGPLFLTANIITALAWRQPSFSWATNNISDLGNVHCGLWDTTRPREVCSPWHGAMNSGLVATGALLALGVVLTWTALGSGVATRTAQWLALAGAGGYILAGAYPADANENNHFLAALLVFVLANAGIVAASLSQRSSILGKLRGVSLALGLAGLAGVGLFWAQVDLGLGLGIMERVAVFPFLMWTVAVALRVMRRPLVDGGRSLRDPVHRTGRLDHQIVSAWATTAFDLAAPGGRHPKGSSPTPRVRRARSGHARTLRPEAPETARPQPQGWVAAVAREAFG